MGALTCERVMWPDPVSPTNYMILFMTLHIYTIKITSILNSLFWNYSMDSIWTKWTWVHGLHMDTVNGHSMWTKLTWSMDSWHGLHMDSVHGFHMEHESTWNGVGIHMEWCWSPYGIDHSITLPYGIHGHYGIRKWLEPQPNVIPYGLHGMAGGVHGVHMHSIWNNLGRVKTSPVGRVGWKWHLYHMGFW